MLIKLIVLKIRHKLLEHRRNFLNKMVYKAKTIKVHIMKSYKQVSKKNHIIQSNIIVFLRELCYAEEQLLSSLIASLS